MAGRVLAPVGKAVTLIAFPPPSPQRPKMLARVLLFSTLRSANDATVAGLARYTDGCSSIRQLMPVPVGVDSGVQIRLSH